MKSKIFPSFVIFLFIITFIVFYRGLKNSNIYVPEIIYENDIPSFSAQLFDTTNLVNSEEIFEYDKYYLINIWASWCIPCRNEHSILIDLSRNKKIKIVGINYKDSKKDAKKFLDELKSPYEIVLVDNDGTIAIEWGAYGVPETFLIYNKKIIKKFIGPLNASSVNEIKNFIK